MGAKKDKDVAILDHKAKKFKKIAAELKRFGISDKKIDKIEEKQKRYELWLEEIDEMGGY